MIDDLVPDAVRTWTARLLVLFGLAAVGLAFLLAVLDGVLPAPLREPLAGVADALGRELVAWVLALTGGTYALWRVVRGRRTPSVAPEFADGSPEQSVLEVARTGNRFEAIVADRAGAVSDPREDGQGIREALADVVVDLETRTGERSPEAVRAAIDAGDWTDDRIAAAFLGGEAAPDFPLRSRIRGWVRPSAAFRHRVERTVTAIHEDLDRPAARVRTPAEPVEVSA